MVGIEKIEQALKEVKNAKSQCTLIQEIRRTLSGLETAEIIIGINSNTKGLMGEENEAFTT